MRLSILTLAAAAALMPCASAGDSHPFSIHDMLAMKRISDPRPSPDGRRIAFVLRTTDLEANRGRTDIWVVDADGGGLRRLTSDPASDSSPRWATDNQSLYFLSTRSGSSQIWRIAVDGGEASGVSHLPLDASNLVVSPDGGQLAFTLDVYRDCDSPECTAQRLKAQEENASTGQVYDRVFVRHWDTWEDGLRSHLHVMPSSGGSARDLMRGVDADTPSQPFGGPEEIAFSPDSKTLVYTAKDVGREAPWSTNWDLFAVPVSGSASPRNLTFDNAAWDTSPAFSPDGKTLAYLAMKRPAFEADRYRIVLRDWESGSSRVLTEDWDRSPGPVLWAPDGKSLYATAGNLGQHSLFRIDAASGQARVIVREGWISSPGWTVNGIAYALDNLKSPAEIFVASPAGGSPQQLTDVNKEEVAAARMGDFEQFTFPGWNDETVHAYAVKPADFDPSKKYPVAFLIHGGPQGSFGNHFHYRWNPQAYAGAGYAVVMVDFHGSTGYGQDFTDSISGDWGGKPLEDLQKGLAEALKRYSWMDGDRVGALGASYGGYMINWIAGNWPDRFRCLVNHDGLFDNRSMYYATEELWFPEWEHGGPYWKNPQGHEKHNPVRFAENWKTPMLVIHGGRDYRVPLEQGLSTFNTLQRKGIPSRFLYFPDENHWVLKAHNGIQWHKEVIGWLDRFLKK